MGGALSSATGLRSRVRPRSMIVSFSPSQTATTVQARKQCSKASADQRKVDSAKERQEKAVPTKKGRSAESANQGRSQCRKRKEERERRGKDTAKANPRRERKGCLDPTYRLCVYPPRCQALEPKWLEPNRSIILYYYIILYYIILYYIILYYIIFYSILFYSIIFYSILFYYILFYSILLYYIRLYDIIVKYIYNYNYNYKYNYIISYYILLYYITLYIYIYYMNYIYLSISPSLWRPGPGAELLHGEDVHPPSQAWRQVSAFRDAGPFLFFWGGGGGV